MSRLRVHEESIVKKLFQENPKCKRLLGKSRILKDNKRRGPNLLYSIPTKMTCERTTELRYFCIGVDRRPPDVPRVWP